ncbi:MAG: glycoside hydrolase family 88 protein, partial [Kiritimatiellae bacterium]|nr:glycoside hydrolase family 88 protein [Kiritimatiellia bacterium]
MSAFRATVLAAVLPALAVCGAAETGTWFGDWPADGRPSDVARRISEQFLSTVPDFYRPENGYRGNDGYGFGGVIQYSVASLWVNAMECARISGDRELEDRLVAAFEPYFGLKRDVLSRFRHVDFNIVGAVPLEIAFLSGDTRARALGLEYADRQWEEPKEDDPRPTYDKTPLAGRLDWWRKGYTGQTRLWIDDAYMIAALQTQAYRLTGERKYIDRAARETILYLDRLQRPNGLFHHAGGAPFFWGRGNGWMAAAMALVLRHLPEDSGYRPRIMEGYLRMMEALLGHQRENGMWGQLVDDDESWGETSCTAMFAFAFAEGVAHGWLDGGKYGPAFRKAFLALAARMDEWGNVASVCAGTGPKNDREYYLKRPRVNGDPHGQAAVLWLCKSILEAANESAVAPAEPAPPAIFDARPQFEHIPHRFELLNRKADGFRGIWYYNQPSGDEYVYKYSGGMGTYCAGHIPMAVYSRDADKTFFCFGGTDGRNTTLLQCVSYFDHRTGLLARPTVVFDKHTVDAHDNCVINLDDRGYIYVFSASHGKDRPSAIARSENPYDISKFKVVWEGNFSYPQPFYFPGRGFLFLHCWYMAGRSNCLMTGSEDGTRWSGRSLLARFNSGHYQRAWQFVPEGPQPNAAAKVGVAFDQHPKGKGLNWRTDVFYMESDDFGETWRNAAGEALALPLDRRDNPALALSYADKSRNVYIKGVKFDPQGRPVVLYTVSRGYRAGPEDGPREWKLAKWTGAEWREIDTGIRSDSNYDFAELYVDGERDWRIIGASETGPQPYNPGGEIAAWISHDAGETWSFEKALTSGSGR